MYFFVSCLLRDSENEESEQSLRDRRLNLELFQNRLVHEFYCLKVLITLQ